jgi:hypothetical protein
MCTHDTRNSSISARWVPCRVVSTAMTRNINKTAVTHNMERQDTHAQGEQPSHHKPRAPRTSSCHTAIPPLPPSLAAPQRAGSALRRAKARTLVATHFSPLIGGRPAWRVIFVLHMYTRRVIFVLHMYTHQRSSHTNAHATHAHASKSTHRITQSRDTQIQLLPCLFCVRTHSLRAHGWGGEGKHKAGREAQRGGRT